MPKHEFLMLAHDFDPDNHGEASMYMSEKLDGIRAFWDGGVSKGMACTDVPWANVEKHDRFLERPKATGLWSRYAQPIMAPEWFLRQLPDFPLDGELNYGRGPENHQALKSIVATKFNVDPESWRGVYYDVFDSPSLDIVFGNRVINTTNFKKSLSGIDDWFREKNRYNTAQWQAVPYYKNLGFLRAFFGKTHNRNVRLLDQEQLPVFPKLAKEKVRDKLEEVTELGGEGLMLRSSHSFWLPHRTYTLLKVKKLKDDEGTVIGYVWGDKSDNTRTVSGDANSKLLGLMGSLKLRLDSGIEFNLNGFSDRERRMSTSRKDIDAFSYGRDHPGELVDTAEFWNPTFPLDTRVTFKYRELTKDGLPKEARYFRKV